MNTDYLIWCSEVRNYELDFQGIVNNAAYFNYLDYARALYLGQIDFNIENAAKNNTNIVLVDTRLKFRKSLKAGDKFEVKTKLSRVSRVKFAFSQTITLLESEIIVLEAESITRCINTQTGKIFVPAELENIEITSI